MVACLLALAAEYECLDVALAAGNFLVAVENGTFDLKPIRSVCETFHWRTIF